MGGEALFSGSVIVPYFRRGETGKGGFGGCIWRMLMVDTYCGYLWWMLLVGTNGGYVSWIRMVDTYGGCLW